MPEPTLEKQVEAAVWSIDLEALGRLTQADPSTWAGSIQSEFKRFGIDSPMRVPVVPLPACLQVAVVMMVKDEADIIGFNLDWLYSVGVRRFVVLDNGSTDRTRLELLEFRSRRQDAELIILDDSRIAYAQSSRTTGMMRLAVSLWPDLKWTFPIDADEFLIPSEGFGPLLEVSGSIDAITIPKVVHFCSAIVSEDAIGEPMRLMPLRNKPFMRAPNVACGAHVHRGVSDGNHYAVMLDGRMPAYAGGLSRGLYYREFQIRSLAHFRRKVINGGPAVIAAIQSGQFNGADHWLHYYKIWQEHGEEGLRALFIDSCVQKVGPGIVLDVFGSRPAM